MKYLGKKLLTDIVCKEGLLLDKYDSGYSIILNSSTHILVPIIEGDNREYYGEFDLERIVDKSSIIAILDCLYKFSNDVTMENSPINERQMNNLITCIIQNPPSRAVCCEPKPIQSVSLGYYKSGDNYSVKFDNKIICDVNGEKNAINIFEKLYHSFHYIVDFVLINIRSTDI